MFTTMADKVYNPPIRVPGTDHLLHIAYKAVVPKELPEHGKRCRFDLFVRKKEGVKPFYSSEKGGPTPVWCLRGDKYADQEYKMIRNLLNHLHKKQADYELAELYDNDKQGEDRVILKFHKGVVEINQLSLYSLLLKGFVLPEWLKPIN